MKTKKAIIQNNNDRKKIFDILQADLKSNWPEIKMSHRVEIHYNTLPGEELHKLTIAKFEQKQSLQIGRIYRLLDPKVDIIYVSGKELPFEVRRYYLKVLELNGVVDPSNRITFVHPENGSFFPDQFTTPSLIYYSPQIIKTIRSLVGDRHCYILNGAPCTDDIRLAVHLGKFFVLNVRNSYHEWIA